MEKKLKTYRGLIIFVDLIGSSNVSNELDVTKYYENYIRPFYLSIDRALSAAKEAKLQYIVNSKNDFPEPMWRYRGDELVGIIFLNDNTDQNDLGQAVGDIIRFLQGLKLFWLASIYNIKRLSQHQRPRGIAAGIHIGQVVVISRTDEDICSECKRDFFCKESHNFEVGYAINVAKRVESMSRKGKSSCIMATGEVRHSYQLWHKREVLTNNGPSFLDGINFSELMSGDIDSFKGIDPIPDVCELELNIRKAINILEILKNGENLGSLDLIGKYLIGERNASKLFEESADKFTDNKMFEDLKLTAPQTSNSWLLVDTCLLLSAMGKANSSEKFFEMVIGNLKEKLKKMTSVSAY